MKIYYAANYTVEYPEIKISNKYKNFYYGLYCDTDKVYVEQKGKRNNKKIINVYELLYIGELRIKKFDTFDAEWLSFIISCRQGIYHNYDIVIGPEVDPKLSIYIEDYIFQKIDKKVIDDYIKESDMIHIISFHTARALACMKFCEVYSIT